MHLLFLGDRIPLIVGAWHITAHHEGRQREGVIIPIATLAAITTITAIVASL